MILVLLLVPDINLCQSELQSWLDQLMQLLVVADTYPVLAGPPMEEKTGHFINRPLI